MTRYKKGDHVVITNASSSLKHYVGITGVITELGFDVFIMPDTPRNFIGSIKDTGFWWPKSTIALVSADTAEVHMANLRKSVAGLRALGREVEVTVTTVPEPVVEEL